jgi:hypothetical protein
MIFQNFFPRKIQFFPNIFGGKFSAEKMYEKPAPVSLFSAFHFYQGCQMVSFQTENTNLGKFWRALEWKMLKNFTSI